MTQLLRSIAFVSFLFFALSGCSSWRIAAPVKYGNPAEVKTMALVTVYVSPVQQPQTPVADASTFNKKTDALSDELNQMLANNADKYAQSLKKGLEMQLGVNVIAGDELKSRRGYDRYLRDEEKEPLTFKTETPFKRIFVGAGGVNNFKFKDGQLQTFINESPRLRSVTRKQARNLEAQAVAFSNTRLVIDQVSPLGKKAAARLYTDIYIYDEKGKLLGHGSGETKSINIVGETLEDYKLVMDQYPELQRRVLEEMAKTEEEE